MPFTEPVSLTVNVLQVDIDNSAVTLLGLANNQYVNSLAQALIRLNNAHLLPGQSGDTVPQPGVEYASTEIRTGNPSISICDVFVVSRVYSADANTTLLIALENIAAIKPTSPYTVSLTR